MPLAGGVNPTRKDDEVLVDLVDHVVGVDPDRHRITAAGVSARPQGELAWRTFRATARGYRAVERWAAEFTETGRRAWAIEGSGSFGASLAAALAANAEYVIEFAQPPLRASTDGVKSDALDAVRAAQETLGRAAWSSPRARGAREGLRTLIVARDSAKIARVSAITLLKALIATAPEDIREHLDRHTGITDPRDANDVVTKLHRVGLGHSKILPDRPLGQARSEATHPCSRPKPLRSPWKPAPQDPRLEDSR